MNFGLLSDDYAPVVSHSTSNIMTLTHCGYRAVYIIWPLASYLNVPITPPFLPLEHTNLGLSGNHFPLRNLHVGGKKKRFACVDPYCQVTNAILSFLPQAGKAFPDNSVEKCCLPRYSVIIYPVLVSLEQLCISEMILMFLFCFVFCVYLFIVSLTTV